MENNNQELNNQVNTNNNQPVQSNNKTLMILMALIIVCLAGYIVYAKFIQKGDNPEPKPTNTEENGNQTNNENNELKLENSLITDENAEYGSYGVAYVEGYAKVVEESTCNDGPDICQGDEPKVNEVSFYVTNRKVDEIKDWFATNENNEEYIPLGCLEDGSINLIAMAEEFYKGDNPNSQENYAREIKLSKEDSDKIIASNENSPIILKIEKKKMKKDIRIGLYTCNSTITGVEVVK